MRKIIIILFNPRFVHSVFYLFSHWIFINLWLQLSVSAFVETGEKTNNLVVEQRLKILVPRKSTFIYSFIELWGVVGVTYFSDSVTMTNSAHYRLTDKGCCHQQWPREEVILNSLCMSWFLSFSVSWVGKILSRT